MKSVQSLLTQAAVFSFTKAAGRLLPIAVLLSFSAQEVVATGLAPIIDAGPNKFIALPAKDLSLFGHASDFENDPLAIKWTQLSGPAPAKFSAPRALATTVTFSATGTYVFQLSVNDGTSIVTASMTVTVSPESSQDAFYIDPTYTSGNNDGSAAHPWTTLSAGPTSDQWIAINNALANRPVIVYFSARQADLDLPEVTNTEINLWRNNTGSNRLTLDGMSKYNTNDAEGSWVTYGGLNKFTINITTNGPLSIGVGSDHPDYPANYTTIRGFDVSGATGRLVWAGNYTVLEYIHSHDVTTIGATVMFHNAMHNYPDCSRLFGNMQDITIRNNLIEEGEGEGIYLGGNYITTDSGGCPSWGNTHSDILIEGNTINYPGQNGGEGDGIDLKAGLTNLTVRKNIIAHTRNGTANCIGSLGVFNSGTVQANYLIEGNVCNDTQGIVLGNVNGAIVRNNVVYPSRGIATTGDNDGSITSYDVRIYNNTIQDDGIVCGGTDGFYVRNNLFIGTSSLDGYSCRNIDSDYNLLSITGFISSKWLSGGVDGGPLMGNEANSLHLASSTGVVVDLTAANFHLAASSPAIGKGVNLSTTGFVTDIDGITRPQGTGWDMGAYQYTTPDFTLSTFPDSVTVPQGQSIQIEVILTPSGGYNISTIFSCSGLPASATCTFTPATLTPEGEAVSTNLMISTAAAQALLQTPQRPGQQQPFRMPFLVASIGMVGLLLAKSPHRNKKQSTMSLLLLVLCCVTIMKGFAGCAGSGSGDKNNPNAGTSTGTIQVTITAASQTGAISRSTTVTLNVH